MMGFNQVPSAAPVPVPQQMSQPQQQQFGQYMQPQQQQQQQTGQYAAAVQQPPRQATPVQAPPQKAPIPEEYAYLQTVFNELRQQCSNAAVNPVRRISKLENKCTYIHCINFAANEAKTGRCCQATGESLRSVAGESGKN